MINEKDIIYLNKCYNMAKKHVDPMRNIAVGALIVKDGKILGKGCRKTVRLQENPIRDMTFHAEHIAILDAIIKCNDIKKSTIYSTVEPCKMRYQSEVSKDPPRPCCILIKKYGIKRVVVGAPDENFGGGGGEFLKRNNIIVDYCNEKMQKKFKKLISKPTHSNKYVEQKYNEFVGRI